MDLVVERAGGGGGVPLVWGHGLTSSMAAEEATGSFRWTGDVVRYDARSHGRSPVGTSVAQQVWSGGLADDYLDVVRSTVGPSAPFVAGGASMGCATALFAALRARDRVQGLVLAIPPTAWETRAAQADT